MNLLTQLETSEANADEGSLAEDSLLPAATLPPIKRTFPAGLQQEPGTVYQLGVFSKLESAEKVQSDLLSLGLEANVDKRVAETGFQYIVMLGPYRDPESKNRVRSILDHEQIGYYLRTVD